MTEEEKAEQYAKKECCATCHNINHSCKEKCECWEFAKKGFLAGLHEGQLKWHKYPEKKPEIGTYLVCFQLENGYRETFELEYTYDDEEELHWLDDDCEVYDEKIIAWTEKPQFKE